MSVDRVAVVGAGLIGTSIGLALARRGQEVTLFDRDPQRAAAAAALGAGRAGRLDDPDDLDDRDHVVVAVPPDQTPQVVSELERLMFEATFSDVSSVKTNVLDEVETLLRDPSRFCGGHPIAGRERGGPGAAQPTLFDGAVWAITPLPATSARAAEDVAELAQRCGARVVRVSAAEHDVVLATVSHAPQLVASVLAAQLAGAGTLAPALAGPGFRDTTRLADSDPDLWGAIAAANAGPLAGVLERVADDLEHLAGLLRGGGAAAGPAVADAVAAGNRARALLPGKHRSRAGRSFARVGVVLADQPGELGRLLSAAGAAGVNVEDLSIDHAPDHPVGYVDLHVRPEAADRLVHALGGVGWAAHRND